MNFKKQNLTGYFALILAVIFLIIATFSALTAFDRIGGQSLTDKLKGKWTSSYEGEFDDNLAHYTPSLNFWNKFAFSFFKEGKKGVLIGKDGWLFTTEEFDQPEGYTENVQNNLAYISKIKNQFQLKNIELIILPLPAKARVMEEKLGRYKIPENRVGLYNAMLSYLQAEDIKHVRLLPAIKNNGKFFLKTDTHWTPWGADYAARDIAAALNLDAMLSDITEFQIEKTGQSIHEGDLMRYTISSEQGLSADDLNEYKITQAESDGVEDLFAETYIPVALIGTSYSANKSWHFENFLKHHLSLDVLNMADEGLGPFATMKKFLKSNTYKNAPPKLIVWEIPERFLPVHYNLNDEQ